RMVTTGKVFEPPAVWPRAVEMRVARTVRISTAGDVCFKRRILFIQIKPFYVLLTARLISSPENNGANFRDFVNWKVAPHGHQENTGAFSRLLRTLRWSSQKCGGMAVAKSKTVGS